MFNSYNPLPQANPAVDKPRAEMFCGHQLFIHRDAYYFLCLGGVDNGARIREDAIAKAAEGANRGFPIYFCLQFTGGGEVRETRWVDPGELEELDKKWEEEDGHRFLRITLKDFQALDPWDEDALLKKPQGKQTNKQAKGLADTVLEFVKANPGCTNAQISEHIGKLPNETSGLLSALVRNGQLRREKEEQASGERRAFQYWAD